MGSDCCVIVGMSDADSFRFARCAGSIDKCGHIFGQTPGGTGIDFFPDIISGLHAEMNEIIPEDRDIIVRTKFEAVILENYYSRDAAIFLPVVVGQRVLMTVTDEEHFRSSIFDNEVKLLLAATRIKRNGSQPVAESSEFRNQNLRRVGRADCYSRSISSANLSFRLWP